MLFHRPSKINRITKPTLWHLKKDLYEINKLVKKGETEDLLKRKKALLVRIGEIENQIFLTTNSRERRHQ